MSHASLDGGPPMTGKARFLTAPITAHPRHVSKRVRRSVGLFPALLVGCGGAGVLLGLLGAPAFRVGAGPSYWSATFDVLNNFLPIWAGLIALGLALALVRRRPTSRIFLGTSALLLITALAPIASEVAGAPERVARPLGADAGRSLRLIQFNALNSNVELGKALDLAMEHDADLIMVEEPNAFRGLEPYLEARYPFSTPCPRQRCRAIIYSRLEPLAAEYETLRGDWFRPSYSIANGPIGVASMELRGPDGEPFTVMATHFHWPYPVMPVAQQRRVFLDHLAGLDRTRTVVAGDFNLTPWTYEMRKLDSHLLPMERVTRALATYPVPLQSGQLPVPLPVLPIDHVYAGSRWELIDAERGPDGGSDHYPVIVDLIMPSRPDAS